MNQSNLSLVLQTLTRHNYLKYHDMITGNSPDDLCRFRGEVCEEFIHLACECPALVRERLDSFQTLQSNICPIKYDISCHRFLFMKLCNCAFLYKSMKIFWMCLSKIAAKRTKASAYAPLETLDSEIELGSRLKRNNPTMEVQQQILRYERAQLKDREFGAMTWKVTFLLIYTMTLTK